MIKNVPGSIFSGCETDAIDMAEELVPHFFSPPERVDGESNEAYEYRVQADKSAAVVEMLSNAAEAMDVAVVRKTVDVIRDGEFAAASMFKFSGGMTWRQMVLQWITDTFGNASPTAKSRVADVITILIPALRNNSVEFDMKKLILLVMDRGQLHMPWKVRLACELTKDAIRDESISHEKMQQIYDQMMSADDSREKASDPGEDGASTKIPGYFKITASGYRIEIDIKDEAVARTIERKLNSLVEWQWEQDGRSVDKAATSAASASE